MTNEEHVEQLKKLRSFHNGSYGRSINKAIQALEQEPSTDAVSRQAVDEIKELMTDINGDTVYAVRMSDIRQLPSVKPQEPKTGRWITWKEAENEIASETRFECSVCHDSAQTLCNGLDLLSPYCPNCGAKMVEPQESETQK